MGAFGWISLATGLVLVVAIWWLTRTAGAQQTDPSMRFEGIVAVGFGALLAGTPVWLVQVGTAVVAGLRAENGRVWLVLVVWALLTPGLAACGPAYSLSRRDPGR